MSGGPVRSTVKQRRNEEKRKAAERILAESKKSIAEKKAAERVIKRATPKEPNDPTKRAPRIARPTPIKSLAPPIAGAGGGSELADINLTALAYSIFGEEYVKELFAKEIIRTVRDIWELSSPTTQCENIVGKSEGATCWICSLPIEPSTFGLTPECEHVLPIAQAVVYLGLYSTAAVKELFPSNMTMLKGNMSKEYLTKEYKWAHQVCNQVKNDDSYLDFDLTTGQYFVRTDKIRDLLNRIKTNSRSYGNAIKDRLKPAGVIDRAITNAIAVYQEICDFLNKGYEAPRLLELAGIISAGYGPRKVGINPRWEHGRSSISQEELEGNLRKEIIKANIEYEGIVQKTLAVIEEKFTEKEILAPTIAAFRTIANRRRPEYISLLMRITPTQTNMKYAIRYIRSQLFSELAAVDATTLGLSDSGRRRTANDRFRELLTNIGAFTPLEPNEKFNGELVKANHLYQEDSSIGDTIKTMLSTYIREESAPANIASYQSDLSNEIIETGGESDPGNVASEYSEIISAVSPLFSSMMDPRSVESPGPSIRSTGSDPWLDSSNMEILHSEEIKWDELTDADERVVFSEAVDALRGMATRTNVGSALAEMSGGSRKRTRKIRRRRM
jgi:hypothetical protein